MPTNLTNKQSIVNKTYLRESLLTMQAETALFVLTCTSFKQKPSFKKASYIKSYFIDEGSKLSINISQDERKRFNTAYQNYINSPCKATLSKFFKRSNPFATEFIGILNSIMNLLPQLQLSNAQFKPEWDIFHRIEAYDLASINQDLKKAGFNTQEIGLEQLLSKPARASINVLPLPGLFSTFSVESKVQDSVTLKRLSCRLKY